MPNLSDSSIYNYNDQLLFSSDINKRAISAIRIAWNVFSNKVAHGLITVNKEASMQLQYAYLLQQMIPLVVFQNDEKIDIELETTITDGHNNREVDILILVYKGDSLYKIALELKCYKKYASSGGLRGAGDIFMKNVYQDIYLLERYCKCNQANYGISLVMTDDMHFIFPKSKNSKCWNYDISQGTHAGNQHINTPVGGQPVDILLTNTYCFNWNVIDNFGFLFLHKS